MSILAKFSCKVVWFRGEICILSTVFYLTTFRCYAHMLIFTQKDKTDIREIIVEYFSTNEFYLHPEIQNIKVV